MTLQIPVVTNCAAVTNVPPNPNCCTDSAALCPTCAASAFNSYNANNPNPYERNDPGSGVTAPAPLPVTNWDAQFAADAARKPSPNVDGSGQAALVENSSGERPIGGPLGLPRWDW